MQSRFSIPVPVRSHVLCSVPVVWSIVKVRSSPRQFVRCRVNAYGGPAKALFRFLKRVPGSNLENLRALTPIELSLTLMETNRI
jgi:hypothetical protein